MKGFDTPFNRNAFALGFFFFFCSLPTSKLRESSGFLTAFGAA